jgi:hypothetical protein
MKEYLIDDIVVKEGKYKYSLWIIPFKQIE